MEGEMTGFLIIIIINIIMASWYSISWTQAPTWYTDGQQDQKNDLLYIFEELSCSSSSEAVHMMGSINMGSCTLNRLPLYFILWFSGC